MIPFELATPLYRVETASDKTFQTRIPLNSRRPPSYVSYLVDNLWEWKRPENFPNRRYAVFANPDCNAIQVDGTCYEVQMFGACKVAQTQEIDARFHADCKSLPKLVLHCLGRDWPSLTLAEKTTVGALYTPCLSKDEIEHIFQNSILQEHQTTIGNKITFWQTVTLITPNNPLPYPKGEVFFEAEQWKLKG